MPERLVHPVQHLALPHWRNENIPIQHLKSGDRYDDIDNKRSYKRKFQQKMRPEACHLVLKHAEQYVSRNVERYSIVSATHYWSKIARNES
jgi:hypothetical protein